MTFVVDYLSEISFSITPLFSFDLYLSVEVLARRILEDLAFQGGRLQAS